MEGSSSRIECGENFHRSPPSSNIIECQSKRTALLTNDMATDSSKNLETDFEKLHLATRLGGNVRSRLVGRRIVDIAQLAAEIRLSDDAQKTFEDCVRSRGTRLALKTRALSSNFITKRRKKPLLKPATLILKSSEKDVTRTSSPRVSFSAKQAFSSDKLANQRTFKSLITSETTETSDTYDTSSFKNLRLTKDPSLSGISVASKRENTSSCSIQTKTDSNVPDYCDDDTSIGELASYFELFVHIPKKMSSMAEMMYV